LTSLKELSLNFNQAITLVLDVYATQSSGLYLNLYISI